MDHTTRTSRTRRSEISNQWHKIREWTNLVEIGHFCDVGEVDDGEVLDFLGDRVQSLVHRHALAVPIMAEPDYNNSVFLGLYGLVDVPS